MTMTHALLKPAVHPPVFICGRYTVVLNRPRVMGVVNVTPDSFSDGGRFADPNGRLDSHRAIVHAQSLVEAGADILDVGGESTRPGAVTVSAQEELDRVMPVLEGVCDIGVPISIDTRRPEVMRAAIALGVDIINDVNGFRDPESLEVAVASSCGLCVMHMLGEPQTMQRDPQYQDVIAQVYGFLLMQEEALLARGVNPARIALDPGIGFGKTLDHNLLLLSEIQSFAPKKILLLGVSRKSMIGTLTGHADPRDRVAGSVAAALWAAAQGAQILRVHDVRQTVDALRVWEALSIRSL